ncbi:MAG: cysteine protease StiP family protein [Magnetococcales bacterium]|nr:cysteine protease StiP family protein [Magnetococcales bacterium]
MMGLADGFSGSYAPVDVTFLLKPVTMAFTEVAEKERAIQSGVRHYSEMLAPERPPSQAYLAAFREAFALNRERVGRDVARLARALALREGENVVLVSLARAGTPVGVLLRRALALLGRKAFHYSVSIIRDRGIDRVAMRAILAVHPAAEVVFVDGWTGKGTIGNELARVVAHDLSALRDAPLCVLSDLAGVAALAAGDEDYLIPSAILNGVVSGLVSRTVLNNALIGPGEFHGCVVLDHLASMDLSRDYVDRQMVDVAASLATAEPARWGKVERSRAARRSGAFLAKMLARVGTEDRNRIKPGIGEATRAMLRRMPAMVLVRDPGALDIKHLMGLAAERGIETITDPELPYKACAVIQRLEET